MTPLSAQVFSNHVCQLGEGACWHHRRASFFWVDILEGYIFEKKIGGKLKQWKLDCFVSAIFEMRDRADQIWAVSNKGLLVVSLTDGAYQIFHPLKGLDQNSRSNDAGVDPDGNLVYSVMSIHPEVTNGSVYKLTKQGETILLINKLGIPNTFRWDNDGRFLYTADSSSGKMYRYRYGENEVFDKVEFFSTDISKGHTPDGSAVDQSGRIWNACWGASAIRIYEKTGTLYEEIHLPIPQPTSCCFGADGHLLITSACIDLPARSLSKHPLSGCTFILPTSSRSPHTRLLHY